MVREKAIYNDGGKCRPIVYKSVLERSVYNGDCRPKVYIKVG